MRRLPLSLSPPWLSLAPSARGAQLPPALRGHEKLIVH
jgi:hypothetical protein